MDSKVNLSILTCGLHAGCCKISTFTSFKGRETLSATEVALPSLFCPLAVRVWEGLLCHLSFIITPALCFLQIQFFFYSLVAELIRHVPSLVCLPSEPKSASHPEGHWSDALRARFSTFLCVSSLLTSSIMWAKDQFLCFSLLSVQF